MVTDTAALRAQIAAVASHPDDERGVRIPVTVRDLRGLCDAAEALARVEALCDREQPVTGHDGLVRASDVRRAITGETT